MNDNHFQACPTCGVVRRIADVHTLNGLASESPLHEWLCDCNFEGPEWLEDQLRDEAEIPSFIALAHAQAEHPFTQMLLGEDDDLPF